jgi:hypothetical protein
MADRVSINVVRLAELLLDLPYVTARRAQRLLEVTFPTAQNAIDQLVQREICVEITGQRRNRVYYSPRVFDVVYGIRHMESQEDLDAAEPA